MTLLEMKKKVLRMIEEVGSSKLTDDPDIEAKLNDVINQVMFEVARMKKIPAKSEEDITASDLEFELTSLDNFYQLNTLRFKNKDGEEAEWNIFDNIVEFSEEGTAVFYYYKYPKRITDSTVDERYKFELSDDALEVMVYGVAADLLKSDVSNNYGQIYSQRYETMLQRLDPRYAMGSIRIEGGVDI